MTDAQRCFKLAVDFTGNKHKVLVDKVLSATNHRLYRQGMTYRGTVKVEPDFTGVVHLYTLTHTWKMRAAYRLAKKKWLEATKEERKALKGSMGQWFDFRIGDGLTGWGEMKPIVWDSQLTPQLYNPFLGGNASYAYTDVADPVGTQWDFVPGDGQTGYFGLIEQLDDATNPTIEQEQTGPGATRLPYSELDIDEQEAESDNFRFNGEIPPYHKYDALGSGVWQYVGSVGVDPTTGAARLSSGVLDIPLGMLLTVGLSAVGEVGDPPVGQICLHMQPGSYRGVQATPFAKIGGF